MSKEKPLFSIIIPIYNAEEYIEECINSVLCQSYERFEVICVNDGSTDRSLEIIQKYAEQDHRIIIVTTENNGLPAARNEGIKLASGQYIQFLDSDDYLKTDALEHISDAAEKNDYPDIIYSNVVFLKGTKADPIFWPRRQVEYRGVFGGIDFVLKKLDTHEYEHYVWRYVINRQYMKSIAAVFDETPRKFEDVVYTFRVLLEAKRIICIGDYTYVYRVHDGSITHKKQTFNDIYLRFVVLQKLHDYINQKREVFNRYPSLYEVPYTFIDTIKSHYRLLSSEENTDKWELSFEEKMLFDYLITFPVERERDFQSEQRVAKQEKNNKNSERRMGTSKRAKAKWVIERLWKTIKH